MSRRVTAARDRCLELERVIAGRARSGSLGLDDALKLFDELLPIARPASVHAFNQLLTVVSRAKGRGSLTSALVVSLFNRMARASPTKICSAQVQHGWKACCCHSRNHGVDSMTDDARPAQEEATDVANAVLDGSDAILLGAETRDLHTVETISTVGKIVLRLRRYSTMICQQVNCETCVTVRAAIKVNTSVIICFTTSGRAARLTAKYRPSMLVLSVAIPHLKTNQLKWSFTGAFEAESTSAANESVLKVYLDHGKASGVMNFHDCVVVRQIAGESLVVKILSWMTGHVY